MKPTTFNINKIIKENELNDNKLFEINKCESDYQITCYLDRKVIIVKNIIEHLKKNEVTLYEFDKFFVDNTNEELRMEIDSYNDTLQILEDRKEKLNIITGKIHEAESLKPSLKFLLNECDFYLEILKYAPDNVKINFNPIITEGLNKKNKFLNEKFKNIINIDFKGIASTFPATAATASVEDYKILDQFQNSNEKSTQQWFYMGTTGIIEQYTIWDEYIEFESNLKLIENKIVDEFVLTNINRYDVTKKLECVELANHMRNVLEGLKRNIIKAAKTHNYKGKKDKFSNDDLIFIAKQVTNLDPSSQEFQDIVTEFNNFKTLKIELAKNLKNIKIEPFFKSLHVKYMNFIRVVLKSLNYKIFSTVKGFQ